MKGEFLVPVFTYKCPACGGPVKYNPSNGKFTCEYCDNNYEEEYLSSLDNEVFDNLKESDKEEDYKKTEDGAQLLYNCPSCGAEIVTDETTAATICYYCHNPVVLTGRLAADMKPNNIIPFKITNEDAKNKFFNWFKKKWYLEKGFMSQKNLTNITGVYYPYWMADYNSEATFIGEGRIVTHSSSGNYNIKTTKIFNVTRSGNLEFENISRSALKKADRKLAEGVIPYEIEESKNFEPSYLAGFMAEKRDVEISDIKESVENEISNYAPGLLTSDANYTSVTGNTTVNHKDSKYKYTLLPAWILTYTASDKKVYYYSMNGQTGKVCGKLPINYKKLFLNSGILTALITILLSFLLHLAS